MILISAIATLQKLRIGLRKRRKDNSDVLVKQRGCYKSTFFSPTEDRCLPSPYQIKLEEREFVVDSGVSMHMVSRKDLNSPDLETVTTSKSPTTVITVKGEVQTHDEATVYVKELDLFLTLKKSSRIRQRYCRSENLARTTDIHMSGSVVKNHVSLKMVYGYNATQTTTCQS